MRKLVLMIVCAACGLFLFWKFTKSVKSNSSTEISYEGDYSGGDEQDGIRLVLEQEFKATYDIRLGYVPKERLVEATSRLMQERQANRGLRTTALSWTERGPNTDAIGPSNGNTRGPGNLAVTSGRIRAMWVDLTDGDNSTVWVGSVSGGLWKTTDITASPATWMPVNDFMGNLAISDIVQDPRPGFQNIMYVGTGEKTFNVDAVRGGGVWKSTDGGNTWSLLPSTTSFWNVSRMAVDASGNLYVATIGNSSGIQRSGDGGNTWTNISPSGLSLRISEMKLSSTGRLHVVCGYYNTAAGSSGYRYTDNPATVTSATWTSPAVSFSPTNYNVEIATAGNTLYALPSNSVFETPTVWKSTDGGANWAACPTNPPVTGTSDVILSSGQAWFCIAVGVDPTNPDNVVVGGLNSYRSTNGGATWTQVARWVGTAMTYVHADYHFVTWNNNQVLLATDGGVFYSNDDGATYTDRNVGLRLKQFYSCAIHPTSTNYFIAGAQDNGMHQMNSPGLGGSTEFVGGDGAFSHIDQDQPQYQWGSYVYNIYRRSTNSGSTWGTVTYNNGTGQFINPSDYDNWNNRMYAAHVGGTYVRWENPQSGTNFSVVSLPALNNSMVSHVMTSPYTSNRVYFGTDAGRIVRVDNADLSNPTATNITGSGMSASTVSSVAVGTDDNNLIASFSNYGSIKVWMTTTGGGAAAWTNISGNLPDIPVRWAMFYPYDNDRAMVATDAGIFETDDINGASTVWVQNTTFPIVRTNMLQYRPSDGTVLAATHGRGLWTATIPVPGTYVQFGTTNIIKTEGTTGTVDCRRFTDYTVYVTVNRAPTGTATATLNVSGGTATQGVDFDFTTNGNFTTPSNLVTLTTGSATPQPVTIRVYDDAAVESGETFMLSYTLSGTTDAVAAPNSQTFTFTLSDNDITPVATGTSATATIGAGGFPGVTQPFRSNFEKSRSQFIYLASELNAAGFTAGNISALGFNIISKTSTIPYNGLTISLKNTSTSTYATTTFEAGATASYFSTYSTVAGMNTFILTTPFNWDGISNLLVEICYDNATGSLSGTGDVVSAHAVSDNKGVWQRANAGTGCALVAALNQFSSTFVRPDLTITGNSGRTIESTLSATRTELVGSNAPYYFYNSNGNILTSLNNVSANLGCVSTTILETGTTWQNFSGGQRSQKVFTITPTTNNGASYTVGLYFTAAELGGKPPAGLKIAKTTSATMAGANATNTTTATTSFAAFGSGYLFTATFTGFSNFFLVDNSVILPVTLLTFDGRLDNATAILDWKTSSEINSKDFEIEKSTDGVNYYKIGSVTAAGNSTTTKSYTFRDQLLSTMNYYRLRMNDLNGANKLSNVVLLRYDKARQSLWVVNNPFKTYIDMRFGKPVSSVRLQLVNGTGSVVAEKVIASPAGQIRWDVPSNLSNGNYILRAVLDGEVFTSKVLKQ